MKRPMVSRAYNFLIFIRMVINIEVRILLVVKSM